MLLYIDDGEYWRVVVLLVQWSIGQTVSLTLPDLLFYSLLSLYLKDELMGMVTALSYRLFCLLTIHSVKKKGQAYSGFHCLLS